ncbi:hypothetical protein BJ138DRAFT_1118061 [Hygrophoropsis aurantiaca]|uniref:Uncharacterized protein n=1 Tax=Hygrophoropsis aurantiaca TaxID=72124 RepID=A0ACB7ZXZ1_9AGAM|nr:hypothetical protein BJ138DRAFT_1118061 [Hygrophoropsis aurantiaca]
MNSNHATTMIDAGEELSASADSILHANSMFADDSTLFDRKFTVSELVNYIAMCLVAVAFAYFAFIDFKD